MEILIGSMFKMGESIPAIEIKGIGVFAAYEYFEEGNFHIVKLDKKSLKKLRKKIDKEINYDKAKSDLE